MIKQAFPGLSTPNIRSTLDSRTGNFGLWVARCLSRAASADGVAFITAPQPSTGHSNFAGEEASLRAPPPFPVRLNPLAPALPLPEPPWNRSGDTPSCQLASGAPSAFAARVLPGFVTVGRPTTLSCSGPEAREVGRGVQPWHPR